MGGIHNTPILQMLNLGIGTQPCMCLAASHCHFTPYESPQGREAQQPVPEVLSQPPSCCGACSEAISHFPVLVSAALPTSLLSHETSVWLQWGPGLIKVTHCLCHLPSRDPSSAGGVAQEVRVHI
jgi:hypothetical protein